MNREFLKQSASRRTLGALVAMLAFAAFGCGANNLVVPTPMPPLSAVRLTFDSDTLQSGQTRQYTATALDTLGAVVPNAMFDWSSSNSAVLSLNSGGGAQALSEGPATIFASAGGVSGSATVSVYFNRGWYAQSSLTSTDLNGVFFLPDRRTGWAVGSGGRILATTNAGSTWSMQVSNAMFALNAVWFTSRDSGWAVGGAGTVLHTVDGGLHWADVTPQGLPPTAGKVVAYLLDASQTSSPLKSLELDWQDPDGGFFGLDDQFAVFPPIAIRRLAIDGFAKFRTGQYRRIDALGDFLAFPLREHAQQAKKHPPPAVLVSIASLKEIRSASCLLK